MRFRKLRIAWSVAWGFGAVLLYGCNKQGPVDLTGAASEVEKLATPDGKSTDLSRDLSLMWETKALPNSNNPTHPPNPRASTERAINAAARVFKTIDLKGKTREEVLQALGGPQEKSDSMYNFPFYPTSDDVLVFRFDNGAWGAQYNVVFDESGGVSKVEVIGIE